MVKKITLSEWGALTFSKPPGRKTLQLWARECLIQPLPEKIGREWYVLPTARYIPADDPMRARGNYGAASAQA